MEGSEQQLEEQLQRLMNGQGSEVTVCDVGLDQSKPATLRKNVTYIVCGVIFNDKDEVLMVQEAKQDCYKQWYLPAGRVEVGESLEEALKREVPSGSVALGGSAHRPQLSTRGSEASPGLHRRRPHLGPARQSSVSPPTDSSRGQDPRRDLGGQHGGAGRHAVLVLRPRRQHSGRLQPAARRPAARQNRRSLFQHFSAAHPGPRPARRGRREAAQAADGTPTRGREPPLHLALSPKPRPETETDGDGQEHDDSTTAQPLLKKRLREHSSV